MVPPSVLVFPVLSLCFCFLDTFTNHLPVTVGMFVAVVAAVTAVAAVADLDPAENGFISIAAPSLAMLSPCV